MKTDRELVGELILDSIVAYDILFNNYASQIYGFALSILKSRDDAEEIVQNVFLKIWEKRKSLDPGQSFRSFLFTIAYNDIMTTFRDRAKELKYREFYLRNATCFCDLESVIISDDLQSKIQSIIQNLPERRKQIFILRKDQNMTYREIADCLGISLKTVENNINLAIKYIKIQLGNDALLFLLILLLS